MNYTTTTNGAITNETSKNQCLDLFQRIGNMRHHDRLRILEDFETAYQENKELATQVLFWARAARIGSGERKTFHTILSEIGKTSPDFISDNAKTIAELGYWKDLVPYLHIPSVVAVFAQAIRDKDRLACKWAPRKCAVLRDELNMTNKEYRKWLKKHSETIEQTMSMRKWGEVVYSSVPGAAMRKYSRAFGKNDFDRFDDWKNDKTSKASVSATYPHEVLACDDDSLAEKLWNNLPDLLSDSNENILPMIDVSGSMSGSKIKNALKSALAIAKASTMTNNIDSRTTSLPTFTQKKYPGTFQVYRSQQIQEYISGSQDGIYHLLLVNSSNKPTASPFSTERYSQPIQNLYPQLNRDNPVSDPKEASSYAVPTPIG